MKIGGALSADEPSTETAPRSDCFHLQWPGTGTVDVAVNVMAAGGFCLGRWNPDLEHVTSALSAPMAATSYGQGSNSSNDDCFGYVARGIPRGQPVQLNVTNFASVSYHDEVNNYLVELVVLPQGQ